MPAKVSKRYQGRIVRAHGRGCLTVVSCARLSMGWIKPKQWLVSFSTAKNTFRLPFESLIESLIGKSRTPFVSPIRGTSQPKLLRIVWLLDLIGVRIEQGKSLRQRDRQLPSVDAELLIDVLKVEFYRVALNAQIARNNLVGVPLRKLRQDLQFAIGEYGRGVFRGFQRQRFGEPFL